VYNGIVKRIGVEGVVVVMSENKLFCDISHQFRHYIHAIVSLLLHITFMVEIT